MGIDVVFQGLSHANWLVDTFKWDVNRVRPMQNACKGFSQEHASIFFLKRTSTIYCAIVNLATVCVDRLWMKRF